MNESDTDNVLDLRVARWRHDPFIVEMLDIIERASAWSELEKVTFLVRSRAYMTAVEKEIAERAKTKV